jgi:hypothetical protein
MKRRKAPQPYAPSSHSYVLFIAAIVLVAAFLAVDLKGKDDDCDRSSDVLCLRWEAVAETAASGETMEERRR